MLATYVLLYPMTTFSLSYGRAPVEPGAGRQVGLGVTLWLWSEVDDCPALVGVYLAVAGGITLVALPLGKETKDTAIER